MRILVEELPNVPERCPFATKNVLNDGYGCVVDVNINGENNYYCKITRERCDLIKRYETTCSGLKVM